MGGDRVLGRTTGGTARFFPSTEGGDVVCLVGGGGGISFESLKGAAASSLTMSLGEAGLRFIVSEFDSQLSDTTGTFCLFFWRSLSSAIISTPPPPMSPIIFLGALLLPLPFTGNTAVAAFLLCFKLVSCMFVGGGGGGGGGGCETAGTGGGAGGANAIGAGGGGIGGDGADDIAARPIGDNGGGGGRAGDKGAGTLAGDALGTCT